MQGKKQTHTFEKPQRYAQKYTAHDRERVEQIVDWLNADVVNRNQSLLARASGINNNTLQAILKGEYPSPPAKWLGQVMTTIERLETRHSIESTENFVETSIYRLVIAACKRAHVYKNFAVVSCYVGTGKTTALKHYASQQRSNVILIEATPDMNAGVLLDELVLATDANVHKASRHTRGTKAERMAGVIRSLKVRDLLLIIDEAETVSPGCLEYVRRISDKAGIGVVLAGTEKLKPMIKDPQGRFGQISSRVGFWPPIAKSIQPDDCNALVDSAFRFDKKIKLTPEIYDAFWQVCMGSARVLMNSLIPGVRDYGLSKGKPLTPELIFKTGSDLLGFKTKL